jgi:hypothetical protein
MFHMTSYALTRLVHILVAVLGIGSITAGAVLARRSNGLAPTALRSLVRLASGALLLMIVSGLLLEYLSGGAFHEATWFRVAFLAALAAGVSLAYGRRALAHAIAGRLDADRAVRRVAGTMWLACALVAFVVILMVRRPFT